MTQYWRGWVPRFTPDLTYWYDEKDDETYDFVYDYETTIGHQSTWDKFNKDFDETYDMLSDEAKAKVQYMSGNLKTVIKKFPETEIAAFVKTSCDGWKDWL